MREVELDLNNSKSILWVDDHILEQYWENK